MKKIRFALAATLLALVSLFANATEPHAHEFITEGVVAGVQVEPAPPPAGYVALQSHWSNYCAAINSVSPDTLVFQYQCGGQYLGSAGSSRRDHSAPSTGSCTPTTQPTAWGDSSAAAAGT